MWIHPFSSECVVVACFSVASKEGDNSSWDYESQCSPQSAAEINVRREEPDSAFGSGLALLFLIFCLRKAIRIPSQVFSFLNSYYVILCQLRSGSLLQTMKEHQGFLYRKKCILVNLWSGCAILKNPHSKLNQSWTPVVVQLGLSSLEGPRSPGSQVLGFLCDHPLCPSLYFGAPVISLSIPLSGLGWDRSGS